jgi:hypothetical protein
MRMHKQVHAAGASFTFIGHVPNLTFTRIRMHHDGQLIHGFGFGWVPTKWLAICCNISHAEISLPRGQIYTFGIECGS